MTLRPFFTYYGGKYRAAPRYPAPIHETIVEPFAGSAGYALRHHTRRVILVEKDPIVAALWRYLTSTSSADILGLPLVFGSVDEIDAPPAARSLIGFWLNAGASRPGRTPSAWMRSGRAPCSFWGETVRARIANQIRAIRHWTVIEGSYSDAPDVEATWFVDPPYQRMGTYYRCSAKALDFASLGAWCRSRRGQRIVCENAGADWLPFEPFAKIRAATGKQKKNTESDEVAWIA